MSAWGLSCRALAAPWLLLSLVASLWAGETPERPWPPNGFAYAGPETELAWTDGTTNLLTNGGFENGMEGWEWSGFQVYITHGSLQSPPLEGTNQVRLANGVLSRVVALPADAPGLSLSFGIRTSFPKKWINRIWVEVQATNGAVLHSYREPWTNLPSTNSWCAASLDLSAFAGQTVRLVWRSEPIDASWTVDDFRLTPTPPGTRYEVWWGEEGQPLAPLGVTTHPGWPVSHAKGITTYGWQVRTIRDGATNVGPKWLYVTAAPGKPASIRFDRIASPQCPTQTFPVRLSVVDTNGFPTPYDSDLSTGVRLSAVAPGQAPPVVHIAEVQRDGTNAVECVNTSTNEVDLSGWTLALFMQSTYDQPLKVTLPPEARLAPGGLFTLRSDLPTTNALVTNWPHLRLGRLAWTIPAAGIGVILRNAQTQIVDCAFFWPTTNQMAVTYCALLSTVALPDWWGSAVTTQAAQGETFQRIGTHDRNGPEDWIAAPASLDTNNADLVLPFQPGVGAISVTPTFVKSLSNGTWEGEVSIAGPATNITLLAQGTGRYDPVVRGASEPFDAPEGACLGIALPIHLHDTAGTFTNGLRVWLSAPPAEDVQIYLSSSVPDRLVLPGSLIIRAGETETIGNVQVVDDPRLTGPLEVTVMATAPGYATAVVRRVVGDDQKPVLSLELPAEATEGGSFNVRVRSSLPPANPISLNLHASPVDNRVTVPSTVVLSPGETLSAPAKVFLSNNQFLDDPVDITFTASYADWPIAEGTVRILDVDPHTLTIYAPDVTEAGQSAMVRVVLGGYSWPERIVSLTSSDPALCPVPATVTIPAYNALDACFVLTPGDDALTNGTRQVTLRAASPGLESDEITIRVFDDDPARFSVHLAPGPFAAGEPFRLWFQATTIEGAPTAPAFLSNALFSASVAGQSLALETVEPFVGGPSLGWVVLKTQAAATGAVIRVEANGLRGETGPMVIWAYPTPTNVVRTLYDARRQRFVVARTDRPLEVLDELSGQPHATDIPLERPTLLALADDGDTLYAAYDGGKLLAWVNLATLQVEGREGMGLDPRTQGQRRVDVMVPLPGAPKSVAVLRMDGEDGWVDANLAIFDFVTPRSATLDFPTSPAGTLAVSPVGNVLTLVRRDGTFRNFPFDAQGLLPATEPWPWGAPYRSEQSGDVGVDAGFGLLPEGQLFIPALAAYVASVVRYGETDARSAVNELGRFGRLGGTLEMFEPFTWRKLGEAWPYDLGGTRTQLAPAGGNRWLAVRNNRLMLATVEAPAPAPATDVEVQAQLLEVRQPERETVVRFRVSNLGTNPAPAVLLGLAAPQGYYYLKTVHPDYPLSTNSLLQRGYELGELAPGARLEVTATVGLGQAGPFAIGGFAGSAAEEAVRTNNLALIGGVLPAGQPRLRLVGGDPNVPGWFVYFGSLKGRSYWLESAETLNGPWLRSNGPMQGDGTEQHFGLNSGRQTEFFRVVEE